MKSEKKIQAEIVTWYHNNYCLPGHDPRAMIFHVPNEGQFKLMNVGLYPGVADLVVIHHGRVMFFEVKEPNKGRQSESQIKFEKHCKDCKVPYHIVKSLEEFQQRIFFLSL